jgi:hypothetical protein
MSGNDFNQVWNMVFTETVNDAALTPTTIDYAYRFVRLTQGGEVDSGLDAVCEPEEMETTNASASPRSLADFNAATVVLSEDHTTDHDGDYTASFDFVRQGNTTNVFSPPRLSGLKWKGTAQGDGTGGASVYKISKPFTSGFLGIIDPADVDFGYSSAPALDDLMLCRLSVTSTVTRTIRLSATLILHAEPGLGTYSDSWIKMGAIKSAPGYFL